MSRLARSFVLGLSSLSLAACTSWELRQRCDETNWFEHSRDLALDGRYLEEDRFTHECKKIDHSDATQMDLGFKSGRERYCTYENFRRNGEAGEPVNFKMCDNLVLYQTQERYAEGLRKFCQPDVATTYGNSGKVYKNVCYREQETKFLPAYFAGRKAYLERSIVQTTEELDRTQILQAQLGTELQAIEREINNLPSPQVCRDVEVYDPATQKSRMTTACEETSYIRYRRSNLYSQIDPLRAQYSAHAQAMGSLRDRLQEFQSELTKIPVLTAGVKP